MDELITKLKKQKDISRADIEELLASIGKTGEKHQEKVDAVKSLNRKNFQGIGIEATIDTYKNF